MSKNNKKNLPKEQARKLLVGFKKLGRIFFVVLIILSLKIGLGIFENELPMTFLEKTKNELYHSAVDFLHHSWIEICCAVIFFVIIERNIEQILLVPERIKRRNFSYLLSEYRKSSPHKIVRILDVKIFNYIEEKGDLFHQNLKDMFTEHTDREVQILLLHPRTFSDLNKHGNLDLFYKQLHDIKTSLHKLHEIVVDVNAKVSRENNWIPLKLEVKLFTIPPAIVFTSWSDKANFALLSLEDFENFESYLVYLKTDIGESFVRYFDRLWKDDKNTIALEDYLYAKVQAPNQRELLKKIYWAGSSGNNSEKPKYLMTKEHGTNLDKLWKSGINHTGEDIKENAVLAHNGKLHAIKFKNAFNDNNSDEYKLALDQFQAVYGDNFTTENTIYEIEYFSEIFKVRLTEFEKVHENLERKGYSIHSHTDLDMKLDSSTRNDIDNFFHCLNELLELDEFEEKIFKEYREIEPEYKNNPRKRLGLKFRASKIPNGYKITELNEPVEYTQPYSIGTGIFKRSFNGVRKFSTPMGAYNNLKTNSEFKSTSVNENDVRRFTHIIQSTVRADLFYLLGERKYISGNTDYNIYVNLIRTEVGSRDNLYETSHPTPQGKKKHRFVYQAIHLLNRSNVDGGITEIFEKVNLENENIQPLKYRLEDPFDVIFINNNVSVCSSPINLKIDTSKQNLIDYGYRDMLIIEFERIPIEEKLNAS